MNDDHGAFVLAWTQAAYDDEEIHRAGTRSHLRLCRRMGVALAGLGGRQAADPTELGLAVHSMLERSWSYGHLYEGAIPPAKQRATLAELLAVIARSA